MENACCCCWNKSKQARGCQAECPCVLYVDEDAGAYYAHQLGTDSVRPVQSPDTFIHGFQEAEEQTTLLVPHGVDGFEDSKCCRVREADETNPFGVAASDDRREFLQRQNECRRDHWFEIACRFGVQLSLDRWGAEFSKMQSDGLRFLKVVGFDGGSPMAEAPWQAALSHLESEADVLLWDGDWYCEKGWTHLIPLFLQGDGSRIVVAFQKRAEVPGFHRQYWDIYRRFPGRVWMVVVPDDFVDSVATEKVIRELAWLEEMYANNLLQRPTTWTGDHARYLRLALLLRRHQGATSVMAINGGKTAAATAAVENLMWKEERVKWTVFGGKRVDHKSGQCRVEEKNSTLVELCEDLVAKGAVPASMAFVHLNGCAEGM